MAADGSHAAFSNTKTATYVFMTPAMSEAEEQPRLFVPPAVPLP